MMLITGMLISGKMSVAMLQQRERRGQHDQHRHHDERVRAPQRQLDHGHGRRPEREGNYEDLTVEYANFMEIMVARRPVRPQVETRGGVAPTPSLAAIRALASIAHRSGAGRRKVGAPGPHPPASAGALGGGRYSTSIATFSIVPVNLTALVRIPERDELRPRAKVRPLTRSHPHSTPAASADPGSRRAASPPASPAPVRLPPSSASA